MFILINRNIYKEGNVNKRRNLPFFACLTFPINLGWEKVLCIDSALGIRFIMVSGD